MKILWVKAGKLLPINTGGRIRSYNILRYLANGHDVTVFSYYQGKQDPSYDEALSRHFSDTVCIATGAPGNGSPRLLRTLHYLSKLCRASPYAVSQFDSKRVRLALRNYLQSRRFDVAVCDFLAASLNFPNRVLIPTVLFQHNVEAVLWQRQSRVGASPIARLAFSVEAAKMNRYEPAAIGKFDHVVAVSDSDRRRMGGVSDDRITVVPTGVDIEKFARKEMVMVSDPVVVFTGTMDWEANVDGIEFFCDEIWPMILAEIPDARLLIVGREPGPRVKRLASASVEITGTVPSILEYLEKAAVVIVPLRIGGGTRLKIYEAMAMGKAVVSTSIGAEGLDVHPDRDIVLCDEPSEFAHRVIQLLRDGNLRLRYGREAVKTVSQYDWAVIARRFEEVLAKATAVRASKVRLQKPVYKGSV
jgi:glycosyltransferase involved in cell wall biosynthesis